MRNEAGTQKCPVGRAREDEGSIAPQEAHAKPPFCLNRDAVKMQPVGEDALGGAELLIVGDLDARLGVKGLEGGHLLGGGGEVEGFQPSLTSKATYSP